MSVLKTNSSMTIVRHSVIEDEPITVGCDNVAPDGIELNYFELLNETPEYSEAAVMLDDDIIEYCYVKNGHDGKQYFGFDRSLPGSDDYTQILARHKLTSKMEANTFERYPSGKTVLSRRGKVLEVAMSKGENHV